MDPLSALSVASTSIQIVDFCVRFLSQVKELCDSADGEIEEFSYLRGEAEWLMSLNMSLIKALKARRSIQKFTSLEQDIFSLCTESNSVAVEILKELNWVSRAQSNGETLAALQGAFKAVWKRKAIK